MVVEVMEDDIPPISLPLLLQGIFREEEMIMIR